MKVCHNFARLVLVGLDVDMFEEEADKVRESLQRLLTVLRKVPNGEPIIVPKSEIIEPPTPPRARYFILHNNIIGEDISHSNNFTQITFPSSMYYYYSSSYIIGK